MKTAVEWLHSEYIKIFGELNPSTSKLIEIAYALEQAKEMEKEQIENFFNAGVRYGSGSVMSTEWREDTEEYNFEQYYNQTFKSE